MGEETLLDKVRGYFNEWQSQGYDERPVWYDDHIDNRINLLSNLQLLEIISTAMENK